MDKEISNKQLEKLHYPIWWEIKEGNIEIWDTHNKELNSEHLVYTREEDFIQEQISAGIYQGTIEIC